MGASKIIFSIFIVSCAISYFVSSVTSQDVLGAGGFIRSKKNIDFSRIHVDLYTQTPGGGRRKVESTDAAPHNGYYFIPVEEVGTYILKPVAPRGWKIEPEERIVSIDGKSDNEEFDFTFIGFGITGAVLSRSQTFGPQGITIELVSPDSPKNVLQSAKTDEKGQYVFFGVLPGRYFLRIGQEDKSEFDFDTAQHEVDVGEDVGASTPFQILGYRVKGSIFTSNREALPDLKMLLKSSGKIIKTVKSDQKGHFSFSSVDHGDYVVAFDVSEPSQSSLELERTEMPVTVEHNHQVVPSFLVKSFSANGKVMASSKTQKSLASVKVRAIFGGNVPDLETVTDKGGNFRLTGIQPGHSLQLKAVLDGYDFEGVTLSSLKPGGIIAPVVPARYRLSGRVENENLPSGVELKVKFTSAAPKSSSAGGKVMISEKGTFSIYLPAGKYFVSVELGSEQKGIGFAPVKQEVNVEDAPVSNINFQPIKANVHGRVECLDKQNCAPVRVQLTSTHPQVSARKHVDVEGDGKFQFKSVLPSNYKIEISKDQRCWEKQFEALDVSSDIDNIVFKQLGVYLAINSGHATTLILSGANGKIIQEEAIKKGENVICVKTNDIVSLSTKGCEEFEISPNSVDLKKSNLPTVTLKPIRYRVSGKVKTKKNIADVGLVAKSDHRAEKLALNKDATGYGFSFWAYPGEELSFHPSSEEFLFDPEIIHIFVDHSCHVDKVIFEATSGFFLKGQISPPVAGVKVEIKSPKVPNQKQTSATTNEQGFYKIGPLPGEEKYEVTAEKEGYIFEKDAAKAGNFISKKLAAIVVKVNDGEQELNGAVVSVSGGKSYRSNMLTKQGTASFLSLSPGEYFVKPQLKEYEFAPKHQLITIKEGETNQVSFKAERVAFSIFGKMVSLNGEVESGITLRAKTQNSKNSECQDHSEEATSEANGEFRFRGLKPGCEYVIALQEGTKNDIEKLIPKETLIVMQKKDTHVPNPIVAMRAVEIMDLSLKITDEADAKSEATVKVMISSSDGGSYTYSGKKVVGELVILPPVPKDDKKYTLTVETLAEKFAPKKKAITTFKADAYYKHVSAIIPKTSPTTGTTGSTKKTSTMFIFVAPLVLISIALFFSRDKLPGLVEYVNAKIAKNPIRGGSQGSSSQGSDVKDSADSGDDSSFEMLNVRRRTKKR